MEPMSLFTAALGLEAPWQVVGVRFDPQVAESTSTLPSARGADSRARAVVRRVNPRITAERGLGGI